MRLPDFLIIGGMKCGSTTLYRDLLTNPEVFFPIDKEPENLTSDEVLTPAGRDAYGAMFGGPAKINAAPRPRPLTRSSRIIPVSPGARREVLGETLKVIYLVRDPVARLVSHHHHEFTRGAMPGEVADAVHAFPALVEYSRYATQARPWIEALGPDNVRIIRFEDYVKARAETVATLSEFLGITPRPDLVEAEKVFNRSEGKPVPTGPWGALAGTRLYQKAIRPLLPIGLKDRIRGAVLPKAPARPDPPGPALIDEILDSLRDDLNDLPALMGIAGSVWDLDAIRERHRIRPMAG